jgi:hypothetical protein
MKPGICGNGHGVAVTAIVMSLLTVVAPDDTVAVVLAVRSGLVSACWAHRAKARGGVGEQRAGQPRFRVSGAATQFRAVKRAVNAGSAAG